MLQAANINLLKSISMPWQKHLNAFWLLQGAEAALVAMVRQSGAALVTKLPRLWERMSGPLLSRSANTGAAAPPAQAAADAQVPPRSWQRTVVLYKWSKMW